MTEWTEELKATARKVTEQGCLVQEEFRNLKCWDCGRCSYFSFRREIQHSLTITHSTNMGFNTTLSRRNVYRIKKNNFDRVCLSYRFTVVKRENFLQNEGNYLKAKVTTFTVRSLGYILVCSLDLINFLLVYSKRFNCLKTETDVVVYVCNV